MSHGKYAVVAKRASPVPLQPKAPAVPHCAATVQSTQYPLWTLRLDGGAVAGCKSRRGWGRGGGEDRGGVYIG
eukprot:3222731-Pyramimonas_sp.AAC.2